MDDTDRREADDDETRGLGVSWIGDEEAGISIGVGLAVADSGILNGEGGGKPASLTEETDSPGLCIDHCVNWKKG